MNERPENPYAAPQTVETAIAVVTDSGGPKWYRYAWFLPLALSGCAVLVVALGQSGPAIEVAAVVFIGGLALGWMFTIATFINCRGRSEGRGHARAGVIVSSILSLIVAGVVALIILSIRGHNRWLEEHERQERTSKQAERG